MEWNGMSLICGQFTVSSSNCSINAILCRFIAPVSILLSFRDMFYSNKTGKRKNQVNGKPTDEKMIWIEFKCGEIQI